MSTFPQIAIDLFNTGYNCAQAVLMTFSDLLGIDEKKLQAVTCGFGGGMGSLQKTCGAITGAFMVLSIHTCNETPDSNPNEKVKDLIRTFHERFIALNKASDCLELLGYDKNVQNEPTLNEREQIRNQVCIPCVESAVMILIEMINKEDS